MNIFNDLSEIISKGKIYKNEDMKKHTSFKIGGLADIFIIPSNVDELCNLVCYAKNNRINTTIIGNGSNILVSDKGIRGITIKLSGSLTNVFIDEEYIKSDCGVLLSRLSGIALKNSLSGLEFAAGIPGTVGGAIYMNAGAYGGEMKDIVIETTYLSPNLEIKKVEGMEHNFSYRHSVFCENGGIILSTKLKLEKSDKILISEKIKELSQKRKEKQPLAMPSAGSVFKRPQGYFAGKLIEDCNLKGASVGGAMVSYKHSGFIVNTGNATADDVLKLIEKIKNEVYKKFNIMLESEIKFIGEK